MCVCVLTSSEGSRADDIAQAAEQLNQRWVGFCALLADRLSWLAYQTKVHTLRHGIQYTSRCSRVHTNGFFLEEGRKEGK